MALTKEEFVARCEALYDHLLDEEGRAPEAADIMSFCAIWDDGKRYSITNFIGSTVAHRSDFDDYNDAMMFMAKYFLMCAASDMDNWSEEEQQAAEEQARQLREGLVE